MQGTAPLLSIPLNTCQPITVYGSHVLLPRERCGFVIGIAILLCCIALAGCTQPVIPSPVPVSTTSPPAVHNRSPGAACATCKPGDAQGAGLSRLCKHPGTGSPCPIPPGWTKQENTGTSVVTFTAPSSGMGDTPATMKVSVADLTANPMSLDQFKAAQLAKKAGLESFNLIYDQAYKGTGFSGWKIGYTYNTGTLMEGFEVYIIRGSNAYTVTFLSRMDKFAGFSVQSDNMFKSFQLTG